MTDRLGVFTYHSLRGPVVAAMQVDEIFNVFSNLFEKEKFSQVVEIGTAQGGTTLIVRDALDSNGQSDCMLRTYDVYNAPACIDTYSSSGAKIRHFNENIFNGREWSLKPHPSNISAYIQSPGKTLVLCDGGCKRMEFDLLSYIIKPGDHIMAHDYAKDKEYFNANIAGKIWNWHEIQFSDIEKPFTDNNLELYDDDVFSNAVWLSARKKS